MIYLCIPLGSYLMCFRFLQVYVAFPAHRLGVPHQGHGLEYEELHDFSRETAAAGEAAR